MKRIPLGLSYDDVILVPQYSKIDSRSEVDLSTKITPKVTLKLPLISINMTDVTGVEMAIALGHAGGLGFLPRFVAPSDQADMVAKVKAKKVLVGAAIGCKDGYLERAEYLVKAGVDILTLDVAHGHMEKALEATKELKRRFGKSADIISGVIASYDGAHDLFQHGADSVRVGVGPGTICITRIKTGVGVPQITAVMEASRAARKFGKTVLCDGGTKSHGDLIKGLAAGASAVVIGSQFAGHDEAPGKLVVKNGQKFKVYNASTSLSQKKMHIKALKDTGKSYINHIEGVESMVRYKGSIVKTLTEMEADLRAGFSYIGASNIKNLWKNANFLRVSSLGFKENGSHDVIPNF